MKSPVIIVLSCLGTLILFHLPINNENYKFNEFIYEYEFLIVLFIYVISAVLISILYRKNNRRGLFISILFCLSIMNLIFNNKIHDIQNNYIIKYNFKKTPKDFINPFLNYVMIKRYPADSIVEFKFNKVLGLNEKLIHCANHSLNKYEGNQDNSLIHKIYNSNWWWQSGED